PLFCDRAFSQNLQNTITTATTNMNPKSTLLFCGRTIAFASFLGLAVTGATPDVVNVSTKDKKDSGDSEVVALQRFVVTGSNILRLDMEKIVPVTVLNIDAIEARNALTPVDLLTSLPQVINLPE